MDGTAIQVGWGDAQWSRVAQVVTEEVNKSSVAAAMIQGYGPIPKGVDVVRTNRVAVQDSADEKLQVKVEDDDTTPLWTLEVRVRLSQQQVKDESLSSALLAFRRAANLLALVQDAIVFHGGAVPGSQAIEKTRLGFGPKEELVQKVATPERGILPTGLADINFVGHSRVKNRRLKTETTDPDRRTAPERRSKGCVDGAMSGELLVETVENAIIELDDQKHSGPFACVLGNEAFFQAYTPADASSVLPAERMKEVLNGPVLRSGGLGTYVGIVVAVSAEPFDLVIGTPPEAQFLQIDTGEDYVFRVYERFVLRVKDRSAVRSFAFNR